MKATTRRTRRPTRRPRAAQIRHILVKNKALADKIYAQLATNDAQFAALAKKYTIDPGSKKTGGSSAASRRARPSRASTRSHSAVPTGKVAKPVKSCYGWHVIEATADTVPASQRPLDKALKTTDPHHPPDHRRSRASPTSGSQPSRRRSRRTCATRPASRRAKTTSTAARPRAPTHDHRGLMRRSARLAWASACSASSCWPGCGGSSGSGSNVPAGVVAVVDGQNITVAELETTMNIAKLSIKTSYPDAGTDEWLSLRTRALEALAHDAELRAWARNLGVTVKPSAVDAAVKQTLAAAFPGKTAGSIDQAKVDAEFKSTGHDARAAAAPHRDEAAGRGRGRQGRRLSQGHGRPDPGPVREGQEDAVRAARAPQGAPHPRQDEGARRSALLPALLLGRELRGARQEVLDRQHEEQRRRPRRRQPQRPRQAVRRRRVHARPRASSRSRPRPSSAGT